MLTIGELLKAKFASVRRDLDSVFARLQDSDLPWAPRDGMRTIAGQLLEMANKEKETLVWIQTGVWPDEDPDAFDEETATLEEIKAVYASLRLVTYAYIDSLSEAELEQPVPNPDLWREALHIHDCPLKEVLGYIATHEGYHTGQLFLYLWLREGSPYEG